MAEIWDSNGSVAARRECYLSLDDLKFMLSEYPVEFVVADVGNPLKWMSVDKCYDFWKSEVKAHLVGNPAEGFLLERFPSEYAYVASEWSGDLQAPVVLLEMHH